MKNDPNKNGMTYTSHTLPSLHLRTFFCNMEVCVLLEHVLISYTGGVCYLWVLEASFREVGSKLPRGWKQASARWESSESLCWMMPIVEF